MATAALMGIDQPTVPALLNGRLASFSIDRLLRLLTALGKDGEIVVKEKASDHEREESRWLIRLPERSEAAAPGSKSSSATYLEP